MTWQRRHGKRNEASLDQCDEMIEREIAAQWPAGPPPVERAFMAEETMRHCVQALLLSLNRSLRMTFILGEISRFPGLKLPKRWALLRAPFGSSFARSGTDQIFHA